MTNRDSTQKQSKNDLTRSPVPRYLQLASLFRRRIETGEWPLHEQIPTVEQLSSEYGVAKATIRQALGLLASEGLVKRFRAKGTFVDKRPQDLLWLEVKTDWDGLLSHRESARIEVLSDHRNVLPPAVPHPVGELTQGYRHLRRRHWREDSPFLLADIYIDEEIASSIKESDFSEVTALRLIAGVEGLQIKDARQTLTIGSADIETAELMKLPLNAPIANVYRSAVDNHGQIVLISNGIYRGDIVRVDMQLKS